MTYKQTIYVGSCSFEPQFGNKVVYGYSYKHKKFMCSICGKEFKDADELESKEVTYE